MTRPRAKRNKDLPPNLYRSGKNTWRYRHPVTGKFHGMGADKAKAISAARKLNDLLIPSSDLVSNVIGEVTFGEFAQKFLTEKRRKDGRPLSANSIKSYKNSLNRCTKWDGVALSSITLFMVNELLDSIPASVSI